AHAGIAPATAADTLPPLAPRDTTALTLMPRFTPNSPASAAAVRGTILTSPTAMRAAIDQAATQLFGAAASANEFWVILVDHPYHFYAYGGDKTHTPFTYEFLDPFLNAKLPSRLTATQAAQANDLAGLLTLASVTYGLTDDLEGSRNASGAAYALYDRA